MAVILFHIRRRVGSDKKIGKIEYTVSENDIPGRHVSIIHWRTKQTVQQENIDVKHQIRRPEIGCKLNKLADRTNLKFK